MAAAAAVALWFAVDPSERSAPSVLGELSKERAEPAPATVPAPAPEPAASPALADKDSPSERPPSFRWRLKRALHERVRPALDRADERVGAEKLRASSNEKKVESAKSVPAPIEAEKSAVTSPSAAPVAGLAPPPAAPAPPAQDRVQEARGYAGGAAAQNANQAQSNQAQSNQAQTSQAPQANQAQSPPPPRQQALEERVVVADSPGSRAAARSRRRCAGRVRRVFAALPPRSRFERRIRPFAGASSMAVSCNGRSTQERPGSISTRADEGVTLTAGVAPSTTACWLVGRAGAIVRTIDGRAWQRVRFPEPLDFTAVVAGDARTATVTAADGRQFATTDGGTTWTRR